MVKKVYFNDVKFSKYSTWHRQQHNCLNFSDIDQVSSCNACLEPLFLVETVFFNNQKLYKNDIWAARQHRYKERFARIKILFFIRNWRGQSSQMQTSFWRQGFANVADATPRWKNYFPAAAHFFLQKKSEDYHNFWNSNIDNFIIINQSALIYHDKICISS